MDTFCRFCNELVPENIPGDLKEIFGNTYCSWTCERRDMERAMFRLLYAAV